MLFLMFVRDLVKSGMEFGGGGSCCLTFFFVGSTLTLMKGLVCNREESHDTFCMWGSLSNFYIRSSSRIRAWFRSVVSELQGGINDNVLEG